MREHRTDRLYRVTLVDGGAAFIYVLIEHKSTPPHRPSLQLLGYQTGIWRDWDQRERRDAMGRLRPLPPILPLIVYHSEAEWRIPLDFAASYGLADETLRPYLLDFPYSLVDLGRIDDGRLSREEVLRIGLLILKHGSRDGDPREILLKLGRIAAGLGFGDLVAMVRYIMVEGDETDVAMVRDMLREVTPNQETKVMGAALDAYKAEWKAEGIEIGVTKGQAKGKADILTRQLRRRFGSIPESASRKVVTASDDQLNTWAENILDAATLEDVFAEPRTN
nr:Rpn family recombination-promoting nuclease/putative transposase [Skermanella stibiiresistens]